MAETPEKKLFIDEDWKSKVEAEKEAARQGGQPATSSPQAASPKEPAPDPEGFSLPPASLTFLLTTLATQTMVAMGQVPNPITGKADVRLNQAKHFIDSLAMLEQKTAGNRTADESALLDDLLHQLRLAFVMMQQAQGNPQT
jgi:hypothetical protein